MPIGMAVKPAVLQCFIFPFCSAQNIAAAADQLHVGCIEFAAVVLPPNWVGIIYNCNRQAA